MDEIANVVTREGGMPKWLSTIIQAACPSTRSTRPPRWPSRTYEETLGNSLVIKEPVGVVGATPWNYLLHQIAAKVAYALGAGCTAGARLSEVAPLDAFILAEVIADAACLPACSTWSTAPAPRWARPSPPLRASTW